jgi:2-polyprenyl-6-methoxyphenol hydroxylase-like FAD-dependent oxidoreductase
MNVVVCGGGPIGLLAAMLLARDGHEVTVLEHDPDPAPSPAEAWASWERPGVAQFRQPHNLFPRFRQVVDAELLGLTEALADAGCVWLDPFGGGTPDDDRFRFVTGRRPVVEAVIAAAAGDESGVAIRRGVGVEGLVAAARGPAGVPHVTGVRTTGGDVLAADLVVDAMGRRTALVGWLGEIGAAAPAMESEDSGFVYYSRFFHGDALPAFVGPILSPIGTFSLLTLPGDNGTWSVTMWASAADAPLRALRDSARFERVVRSCPLHAHWLDGTPITDVVVMAGVLDRTRRFVVDDRPVATGVVAVGDAWACTNPSAGRGLTVGSVHAQRLRDAARAHPDDPEALVRELDATTEATVAPFVRFQLRDDRGRLAAMDALRHGREPPPPPDPVWTAINAAAMHDPQMMRAALEIAMCLALPDEVYARPGFLERVRSLTAGEPGVQLPGPDRAQLLAMLA